MQELERLFRKYNNNLVISGMGIIFFGLWAVLKVLTLTFLNEYDIPLYNDYSGNDRIVFFVVFFIVLFLVSALVFFIHYYVGHSAIVTGLLKKKKRFYLIIAFLLLTITIFGLPYYFRVIADSTEALSNNASDATIASMLVDIAFCVALFDLMYSSFRLRQIKKHLGRK